MQRHIILTGAPGAGKTALIRTLEVLGHAVVEEAATDVIALHQARGRPEPWTSPTFIEAIAELQRQRFAAACKRDAAIQFHDRSLICTHALARYAGHPVPPILDRAIREMLDSGTIEPRVPLIKLMGFIEPTAARRISLEDAIRFERLHVESYEAFGFELVPIESGGLDERTASILTCLGVDRLR